MQKNSLSRISISLALVFFLTLVIIISLPTKSRSQGSSDAELLERRIEVTYSFSVSASELVKLDHRQGKVRVWVPYPLEVAEQEIFEGTINNQSVSLEDLRFDSEWGGGILYFEPRDFFEDFTFTMTFILHRKELKALANFQNKDKKNNEPDPDKVLELYDKYHLSDGINDRLARLSEKAVMGKTTTLEKARAIYNFVLDNMEYNKKEPGYGKGDLNRVCIALGNGAKGKGNCTDFHSFFLALMSYQDIPVIFEMGYPLPRSEGVSTSSTKGYHCWAKFYLPGTGWVPVDISEASKDPSKKDYYFGSIDADRIAFSRGRGILLSPPQKNDRLNFFGPDPYIEIDGIPFTDFIRTISYKDIK